MSALNMPESKTTFADFPREIRDIIFLNIASAAELWLDRHGSHHHLRIGLYCWRDTGYNQCITVLHEWAPKSYIAKAACEVFWCHAASYEVSWPPETVIDPQEPLYIDTEEKDESRLIGTPIDLRECIQKIQLRTETDAISYADPTDKDTQSLRKFKRELAQLHAFPRLRQVELEIWISLESDAYHEGMTVVAAIAGLCNELRDRIKSGLKSGLKVTLRRDWQYDCNNFRLLEDMDISWMWEPPSQEDRLCVEEDPDRATWEQYIRVRIADGVGPEAEYSLLEELRWAGEALPQEKDEIRGMKKWVPWMGIDEDKFANIKENWGRVDEPDPVDPNVDPWA